MTTMSPLLTVAIVNLVFSAADEDEQACSSCTSINPVRNATSTLAKRGIRTA
ncbi:hypothetical protein IQ272_32735 [Chroococcidiopsidales cyanobacterium LEGE 13417]|nr:hypothetical protein [Chroococcidiopsidales cyanobacterium LEGE 13417]